MERAKKRTSGVPNFLGVPRDSLTVDLTIMLSRYDTVHEIILLDLEARKCASAGST